MAGEVVQPWRRWVVKAVNVVNIVTWSLRMVMNGEYFVATIARWLVDGVVDSD